MIMTEKRKLSTRNRGEPPVKKRPPTPTLPPKPPEPVEERLPVILKVDQELPTMPKPQQKAISAINYQSIPKSGVLASSIEQSRQKWLIDGIFERYWAKPSKKRTPVDVLNPSKESMSKLGSCSLIIEPHVFETTLYTVKERPSTLIPSPFAQPLPPSPQVPPQSSPPDMRYSSFSRVPVNPPVPHSTSGAGFGLLGLQNKREVLLPQSMLPPFKESFTHLGPEGPPPLHQNPFAGPNTTVLAQETVPTNRASPGDGQSQDEQSDQDRFIKLLAMSAATDNELKALMKIVSTGRASQQQLDEFQVHVDSLHEQIRNRSDSTQAKKDLNGPSQSPHIQNAPSHPSAVTAPAHRMESHSQYFSHYTQPPKPKPLVTHRPDLSAIVFDLGGSGDRFLFPRFSILEYLPGSTQVIVSFLIIRKGSEAVSRGYKDNASYYQPVTMRLSAINPRILEPLARVVAPPDEVRRYMDSVFDKMNRAENVFLAIQLPRDGEKLSMEAEDQQVPFDPSILIRPVYSPPHTLAPLRART